MDNLKEIYLLYDGGIKLEKNVIINLKLPISNFKFLEFIIGDNKTDCSFQLISTYSLKNYGVCSFMNPETDDGIKDTKNNSIEIFGIKYINDTTLECTYSTFLGVAGWVNLWKIVGFN